MKEINLIRGDTSPVYKFQRKNNQGIITTKPQKMWITFKRDTNTQEAVFQKTLDNDIIFSEEDYYYRFQIKPEDTQKLYYGTYGFDIAILNENGEKKTLAKGTLTIEEHYTHKQNEV